MKIIIVLPFVMIFCMFLAGLYILSISWVGLLPIFYSGVFLVMLHMPFLPVQYVQKYKDLPKGFLEANKRIREFYRGKWND
jgi:hypothetical protein